MDNLLKEHGIRATAARLDILNLLEKNDPMTADDIFEQLQDKGAKLSSIYRNLSQLVESNILTKIVGIDNFAYYQLNTHTHKHHLTCSVCKRTMPIENCPIHELQHDIEKSTGYKITNHIFEFIGICPDCQEK
ncbi:MAG: transcriptional repressor [Tissierellia bacterium]|nr:transcriptional repressor [Tissierellia bacterium]